MAIWDQLQQLGLKGPLERIPAAYEGLSEQQANIMDYETIKNIMNMPPDMFRSAQNQQQNVAQQLAAVQAQQHAVRVDPHKSAYSLLMSRLHGVAGAFVMSTNDYLFTHVHTDKVFVFFVHNDRAGHLEDDINLFPSDKLITQVRLLWSS